MKTNPSVSARAVVTPTIEEKPSSVQHSTQRLTPELTEICCYCRRELGGNVIQMPEKGIKKLARRRGINVKSPCCHRCVALFISGEGEPPPRPQSLYIRSLIRDTLTAVKSPTWDVDEEKIRKALGETNVEIRFLDDEIKELLDRVEKINATRNALFIQWRDAKTVLLSREAQSYAARRKKANLAISDEALRIRIFSRDGWACQFCGEKDGLTIDHKIPVFHGGPNDDWNLSTLCGPCNSKKGAKIDKEIAFALQAAAQSES